MSAARCWGLDGQKCRCLREPNHRGPCDFSYTPWAGVIEQRCYRIWASEKLRGFAGARPVK